MFGATFGANFDGGSMGAMAEVVLLAAGWLLFAFGVIAIPLPVPFETPALTLGGLILARRSPTFRRGVARVRAHFPATSQAVSRRSRRWPRALRYVVLRTDPRRVAPLRRSAPASSARARGWASR